MIKENNGLLKDEEIRIKQSKAFKNAKIAFMGLVMTLQIIAFIGLIWGEGVLYIKIVNIMLATEMGGVFWGLWFGKLDSLLLEFFRD